MSNIRQKYLKDVLFVLALFVLNSSYSQNNLILSLQMSQVDGCQIECNPIPDTIYCNESLMSLPSPTMTGCAQIYSIQLLNEIFVDNNFCDDNMKKVERTWQALDDAGNELSSCVQTVVIKKTDVSFPLDIVWTQEHYNFSNLIIEPTLIHSSIFDLDEQDGENDIDVDPGLSDFAVKNTGSGFPKGAEDASCLYDISYSDSLLWVAGSLFSFLDFGQ